MTAVVERISLVPRLISVATAVPSYILTQQDVEARAETLFPGVPGGFQRLATIYRNAAIATRHSCVPIEWYLKPHGFAERNRLYLENAVELLMDAANQALAEAGLRPQDIDTLITVSSTGIATPSLDARLMARMPFRPDVTRLPIFGLGCAGGVLGLARAAAMARGGPESRVLLLVVELCGLTFRHHDQSKSNMIATALFADGAAAAIVSCQGQGPRLGPWGEHTWPDSLDIMGWEIADDSLQVVFSRDIPALVKNQFGPVLDHFLTQHGLARTDIDGFVCHPGGAKVLDALEECFGLGSGSLAAARSVLRDYGNMSAATVLFVLRATLEAGMKGRQLMTTLGPGFSTGFLIAEAD